MKLSLSAAIVTLCWSARLTAASRAYVYTYDPELVPSERPESRTLSPVPVRCVLAQRAGVLDYHSDDLTGSSGREAIRAINEFGVRTPLFGRERLVKRSFIFTEDNQNLETMPLQNDLVSFLVAPAPSANATRDLFLDLARQSSPTRFDGRSDDDLTTLLKSGSQLSTETSEFYIAQNVLDLWSLLNNLLMVNDIHVTAVVVAPGELPDEGSSEYEWGTYEMPGFQSPLRRRESGEPEDALDDFTPVHSASSSLSALADSDQSEPLRGILPACFSSQSTCEKETRNCTGRGQCVKKFTDRSGDDESAFKNCYSCQCVATTSTNRDGGVLTTRWGGPACQKKDISFEFWLFALFTVAMVFLVSFAVGQIWSMGDEELPSVIGAGVSGPPRRS